MTNKITWQQNINTPDNGINFQNICNWWANIPGKEITFAQRLIPNNNLEEINWEKQRFDENFTIQTSQIRGITLYWQKLGEKNERNLTVSKLELDLDKQQLYIYSQSQQQIVIRVTIPQLNYELIELNNPQIVANMVNKNCVLLLRDEQKQVEVKLNLAPDKQLYLLSLLAKVLKLDANFKLSPEKLSQLLENLSKN